MVRVIDKSFITKGLVLTILAILTGMTLGMAAGHMVSASMPFKEYKNIKLAVSKSTPESTPISITAEAMEETEEFSPPQGRKILVEEDITIEELNAEKELDLFARCVQAEAGNQGIIGKRLVADVILNRVDSDKFPDTITDVITDHVGDHYQFAVVQDGRIETAEPDEETYEAIKIELTVRTHSDLLYFNADGYLPYGTPWKKVGGHYFSTE